MMERFTILSNNFLRSNVKGYYNQYYRGVGQPYNPEFLLILKNNFDNRNPRELENAQNIVIKILLTDIPKIISDNELEDCMLVCVPRAKALSHYSNNQLKFKEAVSYVARNIDGVVDGTDCIKRVINTKTTHLSRTTIHNDGDDPYPGITLATCEIDGNKIMNQNIILIDDIYTNNVNIDEDCIQALLDNGAKNVIFYSIGYTRRY